MCFARISSARKKQRRFCLGTLRLANFQHEIPVRQRRSTQQFHVLSPVPQTTNIHFVRNAFHRRRFESRFQIHRNGNIVPRSAFRISHHRRDPRSVRHRIRVRGPSASRVINRLCTWNVARSHHHRENQPQSSVFPLQRLHVAHAH